MRINILKIISALVIASLAFSSCSDKKEKEETGVNFNEMDPETKEKLKEIIYTMPSPMEVSMMLKDVGAIYMHDVLNPVENSPNYADSRHNTALNVGIYGTDLGYSCVYINVQDAFSYLRTTRALAEDLGILGAFEMRMITRFQENLENRDSMMMIVGESFQLTDKYLKDNQQDNIAALIIAGSWIEGLYLNTKIIEEYPKDVPEELRLQVLGPLTQNVAEQKPALDNLLSLLRDYTDDEHINMLHQELAKLRLSYQKVEINESETTEIDESTDGTTMIGNETTVKISPEALQEITASIEKIRNSITKTNI